MKIDTGRIAAFLRSPSAPLVLLHGPDAGLVAARGLELVRAVEGAASDPFRYAELANPEPEDLLAEALAGALTGGRRVVRVRDAREPLAKAVETLLKTPPEALVILEAGELTGKSRLRRLAETGTGMACLGCYPVEPARLPQMISARLRAEGVTITPEAAAWTAQNLSGEEGPLAQAVELLVLYAGAEKTLSLEDARAVLADGGGTSATDAVDAALTGDLEGADRALARAYEEGVSPVGLIRALLGELMRLRLASARMAEGVPAVEAMATLRPPVFFKRQSLVQKMLRLWPLAAVNEALAAGLAAERACKTSHIPDQDFCRQVLLVLASRAKAASRN